MVRCSGQTAWWRQKASREKRMLWYESRARSSRRMRGEEAGEGEEVEVVVGRRLK
jgi:hypothetical protein